MPIIGVSKPGSGLTMGAGGVGSFSGGLFKTMTSVTVTAVATVRIIETIIIKSFLFSISFPFIRRQNIIGKSIAIKLAFKKSFAVRRKVFAANCGFYRLYGKSF